MDSKNAIIVHGASVHNLRHVSAEFPRGAMTVLTGVSGSGKSSLAFDTLFAEGQRRYFESLPPYARSFLEKLERPAVDFVEGLSPAISISQFASPAGPRSTLATLAELQDHLRLLFTHLGTAHCPHCGHVVHPIAPGALAETLLREPEGTRVTILSPLMRPWPKNLPKPKGADSARGSGGSIYIERAAKAGFVRVCMDGKIRAIDEVEAAEAENAHEIDAVVDRIVVREGVRARMVDSVEQAMSRSGGEIRLLVLRPGADTEIVVNESSRNACPECNIAFDQLSSAHFSFNSMLGACIKCRGTGLANDSSEAPCPDCGGTRFSPETLACRIQYPATGSHNIAEVAHLTVEDMLQWAHALRSEVPEALKSVADPVVDGLIERLEFLVNVGLGYLECDRRCQTLSGGELRRVRLASAIGQRLSGVLYVLDEPTAGLHPHDTDRLLAMLSRMRTESNTLVVVEHNPTIIKAADKVIELGPGAGSKGGQIVFSGTPSDLCHASTHTARFINGSWEAPYVRPLGSDCDKMHVVRATAHNLRAIDVLIPLGRLTVITGVSGSGKSTLAEDVLGANISEWFAMPRDRRHTIHWKGCEEIRGVEHIGKVIEVGRASRSRSSRSNLVTFVGIYDEIRKLFAMTPMAKTRGYSSSRFSFSSNGGRCEVCKGEGTVRYEMSFLPDVDVKCEFCGGRRFNRETLDVHWSGRSIADILDLTVSEAKLVFHTIPKLERVFSVLEEVGLGYLTLGQSTRTMSGGEMQRLLLGTELARPSKGGTLYLLDEPSTGQHAEDIRLLLQLLTRLRDLGHTIVVVEHNPIIMRAADWIIDLGPGGGASGGTVIAQGPISSIIACPDSLTGKFLA